AGAAAPAARVARCGSLGACTACKDGGVNAAIRNASDSRLSCAMTEGGPASTAESVGTVAGMAVGPFRGAATGRAGRAGGSHGRGPATGVDGAAGAGGYLPDLEPVLLRSLQPLSPRLAPLGGPAFPSGREISLPLGGAITWPWATCRPCRL